MNQGLILGLIIVIIAVMAMLPANINAAEQSRPQLGLALGGGSALGFTHIGVLKWLEENRIPVDYIAGTSMGGLIGGFYAMGMSPQEIEELVKSVNWDRMFNSDPPYDSMTFRRKEDLRDYPSEIKLGARDGVFMPNGLSIYQVDFLLSRITLPYSTVKNFNELPIPYRCVATDIRSSRAVVLEDGSLPEAMRATMSIPGVFVPVEREGMLLVDGGLVNNVPADVVKVMGADRVIAVNCNESNDTKDLRRLDSFLMSTINSVIVNNTRQALQNADVVIHPEVAGVSLMDWKEVNKFITAGYWAAAEQAGQLRKFALDEAAWQEYLQQRSQRKRLGTIIPQTLEVRGTNAVNRRSIQTALQPLVG
ncbi:MAG TPA: patatin-like phospholipase family protein, partial [Bacillota bacterium]|nr:patatin-like phospholipase family protein [Bacillota bacterium]